MSIKIYKRGINKDECYLISEKKIKEIFNDLVKGYPDCIDATINFEAYRSKRLLAYADNKNKKITDDNILLRCIFSWPSWPSFYTDEKKIKFSISIAAIKKEKFNNELKEDFEMILKEKLKKLLDKIDIKNDMLHITYYLSIYLDDEKIQWYCVDEKGKQSM